MHARGGAWVVAQFLLMALIAAACFVQPRWPDAVRGVMLVGGVVCMVAGVVFALWAGRTMGRSLTPFPRPPRSGKLVETGPFRIVRHPIYSGLLLFFVGLGATTTIAATVLTAALALLWVGKLRVEENHLRRVFAEYEAYERRVRFRLVPRLY